MSWLLISIGQSMSRDQEKSLRTRCLLLSQNEQEFSHYCSWFRIILLQGLSKQSRTVIQSITHTKSKPPTLNHSPTVLFTNFPVRIFAGQIEPCPLKRSLFIFYDRISPTSSRTFEFCGDSPRAENDFINLFRFYFKNVFTFP